MENTRSRYSINALIFVLVLALFTLLVTVFSEGMGRLGVNILCQNTGQNAVPVPDRHRNGFGLGLLRNTVAWPFRFLWAWRVYDWHVADV